MGLEGKTKESSYRDVYTQRGAHLPGYTSRTQHAMDVRETLAWSWNRKRAERLKDPKVIEAATDGYDSKGRPEDY